ncbi:MAG: OmpA family protein [Lutibacter sp.]|uniref:OmpA family protein n=1 Tax=Lutibacter sp. TaxID=1925666 RepID=UPI00385D76BD
MKHLNVALLALLLITGFSNVNAQDENNPWAVGIAVNAVDFYPTNAGLEGHGAWFDEFINTTDHYNILPSVSKFTVSRYLADGFSFEAAGSLNKITKVGDNTTSEMSYYGLDGALKYDLNKVIGDTSWFNPYASVGGGYTWLDNLGTSTFNAGLGINFWFSDNLGMNLESKYKHSFESSIVQHFQHSIGVVFKFGGNDTDGDGVYDKFDACPEVFGLAEFKGCPDSDSDGVIDSKDDCPNTAGLAALNGCPDADEDGIADKDDACPNAKGTKANNGCPDTDGDGVVDKNDSCPQVAGPIENKGCPWPDTDSDGVLDKDDNCVNEAGPASNNGCPQITQVEVAKLEELFKTVYFDSGKNSFKTETMSKLDLASGIMTKYSTAKFSISGHTDSTGSKARNQELSESRANAVKDYLVSKGVSASNLTAKGFGEDMPIASNNTRSGRSQNRRVEVKLVN